MHIKAVISNPKLFGFELHPPFGVEQQGNFFFLDQVHREQGGVFIVEIHLFVRIFDLLEKEKTVFVSVD